MSRGAARVFTRNIRLQYRGRVEGMALTCARDYCTGSFFSAQHGSWWGGGGAENTQQLAHTAAQQPGYTIIQFSFATDTPTDDGDILDGPTGPLFRCFYRNLSDSHTPALGS